MRLDQTQINLLNRHMFEQNIRNLIHFFSTSTSDLNMLEDKMGSTDFNILRSHIFVCKIDQDKYLELLENNKPNEYQQFINLAAKANSFIVDMQSVEI